MQVKIWCKWNFWLEYLKGHSCFVSNVGQLTACGNVVNIFGIRRNLIELMNKTHMYRNQ